MPTRIELFQQDHGQTVGAQALNVVYLPLADQSVVLVQVNVIAIRADGRSKAWSFEALAKKIAGNLVIADAQPSPPTALASAADATALAGISIASFSDANGIGITCTGQAGSTINWVATLSGRGLSS